jgi:hypothetical protein
VAVRFGPPLQFMLMIASVSLPLLQATKKLLVVTVLLAGSIVTGREPDAITATLFIERVKPESKHTAIAVPQSTGRRRRRITLFIFTSIRWALGKRARLRCGLPVTPLRVGSAPRLRSAARTIYAPSIIQMSFF